MISPASHIDEQARHARDRRSGGRARQTGKELDEPEEIGDVDALWRFIDARARRGLHSSQVQGPGE